MLMRLEKAADITFAMEQIIVSKKGNFDNFEVVATNLITEDIQCIELAPDGVIDRIYPSADNEAAKIDLLNDPDFSEISRYARHHKETVIQGPFALRQGGLGIAVRNPIFISDESATLKTESFWGFAIAIIKVPKIFEDSITSLSGFGYDYILTVRSEITKGDDELVLSTKTELNSPETYSFTFAYNKWTLKVTPKNGWNHGNNTPIVVITGSILIILISLTTLLVLILQQKSRKYETLATVDQLTGLLNRSGETKAVEESI